MTEDFDLVFQYLSDESISTDKSEFLFQVKSHPDHPSLLSISDTLSFLGISNGSLVVEASQIGELPDRFVALLKDDQTGQELTYLKKEGESFKAQDYKGVERVTVAQLEARWLEVVFLVDSSEETVRPKPKRSVLPYSLAASLVLLALLFYQVDGALGNYLFLLFPVIGLAFSVTALKGLFGSEVKLISQFCKVDESTDCESVTNSSKWGVFKYLDFGDLSLVFFSTQVLAFIFMAFGGDLVNYFLLQKWLLFAAIPVITLSVYYQKFVEEKWCPVCLSISAIVLLEIGYVNLYVQPSNMNAWPLQSITMFLWVGMSILAAWFLIKRSLKALRDLQEFQLNANRYSRVYDPFRLSLLSEKRVSLPDSPIVVGNGEQLELTVITNPFCGSCKETHAVIEKILKRFPDVVRVKTIFKTNLVLDTQEVRDFHRILMTIFLKEGADKFMSALHEFFEKGRVSDWNKRHGRGLEVDPSEVDLIYHHQNEWCIENEISFTPRIYVNGYKYPAAFDMANLEFYINDLLEDEEVCSVADPMSPVQPEPTLEVMT